MASYELQEKYSTILTPHSISIIENIIKKKPEFFRAAESTLVRNIHNNKIDSNDIPYLISITSQLYNLILLLNITIPQQVENAADNCGTILKFIFSVAIRESLIKVDDEKNASLLLLCCDNIIDACVKLLKLKQPKPVEILGPVVDPILLPKKEPAKKVSTCC
jgi:hypothetical protein